MIPTVAWRVAIDPDGRFVFKNIRPGQYLVAVVSLDRRVDLQDPEFVRAMAAHATRVVIRPGDNTVAALQPRGR